MRGRKQHQMCHNLDLIITTQTNKKKQKINIQKSFTIKKMDNKIDISTHAKENIYRFPKKSIKCVSLAFQNQCRFYSLIFVFNNLKRMNRVH